MTKHEEQIKDIILSYCQGRIHAEFDMDILPEMVSKIAALNNMPPSQRIKCSPEEHKWKQIAQGGEVWGLSFICSECGDSKYVPG